MFRLFLQLVRNDFATLISNKAVVFWSLFFPFFLMTVMILAFGTRGGLGVVPVEVIDKDQSPFSQRFVASLPQLFTTDSLFINAAEAPLTEESKPLPADHVRVVIARGFGASEDSGGNFVQVHYNFNASLAVKTVAKVVGGFSKLVNPKSHHLIGSDEVKYINSADDPTEITYAQYILSGVLVMSLMSTGILTTAIALAGFREYHILKFQACYPMPRSLFLSAFLTSRFILNLMSAVILIVCGHLIFNVHYILSLSSVFQTLALICIGTLMLLSLGLLLGARASTVGEATLIGNLIYFPLIFLSDLTIPLKAFPPSITKILDLLPLHSLVASIRDSLFLGGIPEVALRTGYVMVIWSCVLFFIAVKIFRWSGEKNQ